ncbi:uncharacterized protein [Thunnus thynnus]|uniref:uncharacterized protein LOC121889737 n=1 Tax=Thunnus maccoyii TaxID=8240 RepID=UPI001C4C111A|nr:uncharacterized protein LOC121889737 [Thunnus maccoyii]
MSDSTSTGVFHRNHMTHGRHALRTEVIKAGNQEAAASVRTSSSTISSSAVMDTSTSVLSRAVLTSLIISVLTSASEDHQDVKVRPGQNAALQCQGPDGTIRLLQWSRPDLKSGGYVFFYRDKRSVQSFQHPSFHRRVQLMDPEMKNGNASVILKNVTISDTGTYECLLSVNSKGHRKRATPETMNTIVLKVEDSGHTAGNTDDGKDMRGRFIIILPVAGLIIVLLVLMIFKKSRGHLENNSDLPAVT